MKRVAILMAVLALAAGCDDDSPTQPSNTGPIVFSAALSAANEVPPVTNAESTARGTTTITFNVPRDSAGAITGGGTVTFGIQLTGFPSTSTAVVAAHIHPGAAGANGSPLIDTRLSAAAPLVLTNGAATVSITVDISQDNATNIAANPANFYFNVHTPLNGGGAARGQLVRQ
jgi:CHRD domain